ncbi:uncharacterized protein LOC106069868 isoform X2 [Biomphalaria glabrata]|uniref:Uncharacterized protein LOC106069868 isoform X2 n=1 Tax=Biomphalaria glabrata TaxID=6526 RepID=A0A9W2Z6X1_BIOGL|nr:uncharacterized protein LOC106069868 isoform X2 [Biomphalaria glabrata]KAI8776132.1 hypothetical protein BgiBS90_023288 [Biomphalaria glabrata]
MTLASNSCDGHYLLFRFIPKAFVFLLFSSVVYILLEVNFFKTFPLNIWTKSQETKSSFRILSILQKTILADEVPVTPEPLACNFMPVDPYEPSILKLSGLDNKPVECSGYMPDLTYLKGDKLVIDKEKVKSIANFTFCNYRSIYRHPDSDHRVEFGNWSEDFTSSIELPEGTEFIVVVCKGNGTNTVSKTYHALVPKHEKVTELDQLRLKKRKAESDPKETLNVIMIGMDGTSRNQLMRGMNKTYTFLMKELRSFDMSMYTQVGINTFPNFVPLFSGYNEDEILLWWQRSKHLDPLDTIWRDFNNAGYRTLFTEDYPSIGGFHYAKQGFLFPPTTYYSHPICVAIEKDKDIWRSGRHCIGNQAEVDFHFSYILRFLSTFEKSPVFISSFFTKLTHDEMTNNKKVDEHTYKFYKTLKDDGHLNNSLLITFSDHGPRWGSIRSTLHGIIESRSPYAVLTFPLWFLEKYPDVARNLKVNTKRLTTHFDTHETLRDLLYFKSTLDIPLLKREHGISLFKEIPKNRTCPDIPIPLEFCICNQETLKELPINSSLSKGFAEVVVRAVNSKRNETLCRELKVKDILQIVVVSLPPLLSKDRRLFKIKVETTPGNAIFEGTVQTKLCNDTELGDYFQNFTSGSNNNAMELTIGDSIDRLNLYKGQADCEPDAVKKPYCYCKTVV